MKTYGVIMAGGKGTRFWPISRIKTPKQVLKLDGRENMINKTIKRMANVVDNENIFVITNREQERIIKEAVSKNIDINNVLIEPEMKNTAPCILYSMLNIYYKNGDATLVVYPSDHNIKNEKVFNNSIIKAIKIAEEKERIVTLGIEPTYPATGYGYIKKGRKCDDVSYNIVRFKEKPNLQLAKRYLHEKKYLWNSGILIFKISVLLREFKLYLPKMYNLLNDLFVCKENKNINEKINEEMLSIVYRQIQNVSIEYSILEHSDKVVVIPINVGWNDIGTFDSLRAIYKNDEFGNVIKGKVVTYESTDSIVYSENGLVAIVGVKDLIVISSKDAILVCNKNNAQDIKNVVDILEKNKYDEYI